MVTVAGGARRSRTTHHSEHEDGPEVMVKRTRTRAQRPIPTVDVTTDEIKFAGAGRGLFPEEHSQSVRRAMVLRWARQRRRATIAHHGH